MNLVQFNPVRDLDMLQNQVNRVFSTGTQGWGLDDSRESNWYPAVDIWETADEIVVKAEIPGMRAKDLDVRLENNVLTIHGERQREEKLEGNYYHRLERLYGSFTRSFTIPSFVEDGKIKAEYKDGVLTISLPKKETAKPRRIELAASVN
jgi:HSP20 family protein